MTNNSYNVKSVFGLEIEVCVLFLSLCSTPLWILVRWNNQYLTCHIDTFRHIGIRYQIYHLYQRAHVCPVSPMCRLLCFADDTDIYNCIFTTPCNLTFDYEGDFNWSYVQDSSGMPSNQFGI